jgi:hypothetical protein
MKIIKSKWIWLGICLLVFAILAFIFRETILLRSGRFMAPVGDYQADVVILEGSEFISSGLIAGGMELLSSGKVKRMVIVLQNIAPSDRPYGLKINYPEIVKQQLRDAGIRETDFKVIVVPIINPITLKEAQRVLKDLSHDNVRSAVLLSPAFHTRRSYLVYQHVGMPLNIKIFPRASFNSYKLNNWWFQETGARDFTVELLKLGYYLVRGYIPLKLSY